MASQTKVDSGRPAAEKRAAEKRAAEKRAAERRAEESPASETSDTSASGTFAARAQESLPVGRSEDLADGLVDTARVVAVEDATNDDGTRELGSSDTDFAAARGQVDDVTAPGEAAAPASDDDEDVSLDELMMSDSEADDEEEEDEATDIHPGLSEAVLAESLRVRHAPPAAADASRADASPEEIFVDEASRPATEALLGPELSAVDERVSSDALQGELVTAQSEVARGDQALIEDDGAPMEIEREEIVEGAAAEDTVQAAALPESSPLYAEPARHASPADASLAEALPAEALPAEALPAEVLDADELEVAPESEAEVPSSAIMDAAPESQAALDSEGPTASSELDLNDRAASVDSSVSSAAHKGERETVPATLAAKRRDAPLPSFDIPDLEAASALAAGTLAKGGPGEGRARGGARSVPLPPLSEIDEDDDDDAVTHMGLPTVSEAANDYPAAASGFQVADPAVAALQSLDADISRGDPRRATTRVIPRVDPKTLPPKPRVHTRAGPPLAERLGVAVRGAWARLLQVMQPESLDPALDAELSARGHRLNWLVENVLPPLSLVLFGSGLGAGVIMLVETDRPAEASPQTQAVQALKEAGSAPRGPMTLADRARAGDGEALYKITNMAQGERTSSLTLALEAGYQAQKLREFKEFVKSSAVGAGPLPAAGVSRMVDYATSPETMLPAFQELTQWKGPTGPDMLYAVWEKAAGGSRAASLAQQLLYSADQRAKATPALLAALDLRSAATCDDYLRVLPAVARSGDQRSSATLRALRHNDGCGADGQQDCYACLRDNSLLEEALKAIDSR